MFHFHKLRIQNFQAFHILKSQVKAQLDYNQHKQNLGLKQQD